MNKPFLKNFRKHYLSFFSALMLVVLLFVLMFATTRTFKKSSGSWKYYVVEFNTRPWQESYEQKVDPLIPLQTAKLIMPGLKEYDSSGNVSSEIVESQVYERQNGFAKAVAVMKFYGFSNETTQDFIYKGQAIKVNTPVEFSFPNVIIPGQIAQAIDADAYSGDYLLATTPLDITLRLYSIPQWETAQISGGDGVTEFVTGQQVATVIRVDRRASDRYIFLNQSDYLTNMSLTSDPELSNVDVSMSLLTSVKDGVPFFGYSQPIKVGNTLQLSMEKINIRGEITAVNEATNPRP